MVNMVAEVNVKMATANLIERVGVKINKTNPAIKATGAVPRCNHPRISGRAAISPAVSGFFSSTGVVDCILASLARKPIS
jgi:hypothetical protein